MSNLCQFIENDTNIERNYTFVQLGLNFNMLQNTIYPRLQDSCLFSAELSACRTSNPMYFILTSHKYG